MKYEPQFSTSPRDGAKAIWVKMPNGELHNIWDLAPKECSQKVLEAIESAFNRGMIAQRMIIQQIL